MFTLVPIRGWLQLVDPPPPLPPDNVWFAAFLLGLIFLFVIIIKIIDMLSSRNKRASTTSCGDDVSRELLDEIRKLREDIEKLRRELEE